MTNKELIQMLLDDMVNDTESAKKNREAGYQAKDFETAAFYNGMAAECAIVANRLKKLMEKIS